MKNFAMLALLLSSLSVFAIGCQKPAEKATEPAATPAAEPAPEAAPAEKAPE